MASFDTEVREKISQVLRESHRSWQEIDEIPKSFDIQTVKAFNRGMNREQRQLNQNEEKKRLKFTTPQSCGVPGERRLEQATQNRIQKL